MKDGRMEIAKRIADLSDNRGLWIRKCLRHIALKIEDGPYSDAVIVYDADRVKFFIRSSDLLNKAKAAFHPKEVRPTNPEGTCISFGFLGLDLNDLQTHEGLFREIVQESVRTTLDRGRKKKLTTFA